MGMPNACYTFSVSAPKYYICHLIRTTKCPTIVLAFTYVYDWRKIPASLGSKNLNKRPIVEK